MLTPLYEAKVDPDIYFFGFDLTVEKAKGGTGENPGDDPGWFFVIKERPGEPRFGLDTRPAAEASSVERPVLAGSPARPAGQLHRNRRGAGDLSVVVSQRGRSGKEVAVPGR